MDDWDQGLAGCVEQERYQGGAEAVAKPEGSVKHFIYDICITVVYDIGHFIGTVLLYGFL